MLGASKVNTHSYDALIRVLHKASLGLGHVNLYWCSRDRAAEIIGCGVRGDSAKSPLSDRLSDFCGIFQLRRGSRLRSYTLPYRRRVSA